MAEAATSLRMTAAEYLAWEREQLDKHEFHLGEVYAMAGVSIRHSFLAASVLGELRAAARPKGCQVLTSDMRIAADQGRRYVYADAVGVRGQLEFETRTNDVLTNPRIIVEVLSPSTERYDRGEKWESYQRIDSLTDYVLVSQTSVRVEHFARQPDGKWLYRALGAGDALELADGVELSVDAVYEGAFDIPLD